MKYEVNIFVSLQANSIFLSEKEEGLSIQVEVFALDRDALSNYCVACEETDRQTDRQGDYKRIEGNNFFVVDTHKEQYC